jgi:hypothetical protein
MTSIQDHELNASLRADKLTQNQYRSLQYHFVTFFIEHLLDVAKTFEGDLIEFLVMATVQQARIRADELSRQHALVNTSTVADITGIPRETVRRKLLSLEKQGRVQHVEKVGWEVPASSCDTVAREVLAELDRGGVERVLKLDRLISAGAR